MSGRMQGDAKDTIPISREKNSEVMERPDEMSMIMPVHDRFYILPKPNNLSQEKLIVFYS
jgi:hypothetical protein